MTLLLIMNSISLNIRYKHKIWKSNGGKLLDFQWPQSKSDPKHRSSFVPRLLRGLDNLRGKVSKRIRK